MMHPGTMRCTAAAGWVLALLLLLSLSAPLLCQAHAAMAPGPAIQEVEVMRKLRRAVHAADATWTTSWQGWQLNNSAHPCSWQLVKCNAQQHVVYINLWSHAGSMKPVKPLAPAPALLPELAQLQQLQTLRIVRNRLPLSTGLPPEWFSSGAFPRLTELLLGFASAEGPLPDMQPGALPSLLDLHLDIPGLQSTLPASWHLLPALSSFNLRLQMEGQLPPQWAAGFPQLATLSVRHSAPSECGPEEPPMPAGRHPVANGGGGNSSGGAVAAAPTDAAPKRRGHQLPAEWATGFPSLIFLGLYNVTIAAPFPQEWLAAFPRLEVLTLMNTCLHGELPSDLFALHPHLTHLYLQSNQLQGTLPDAWSSVPQVETLQLADNNLSGPAFPPAWIRPGALPQLKFFLAQGNNWLSGALPPAVAWPCLRELDLRQTAVQPSIPASWCKPQHAAALLRIGIGSNGSQAVLPPCVSLSVPRLIVNGKLASSLVPLPTAWTSCNRLALAATLAAAAAGALAAAAVTKLLRERRRRLHRLPAWEASKVHLLSTTASLSSSDGKQSCIGSLQHMPPGTSLTLSLDGQQLAAAVQDRLLLSRNHSVRLTGPWLSGPAMQQGPGWPDSKASSDTDFIEQRMGLLPAGTPAGSSTAMASWTASSSSGTCNSVGSRSSVAGGVRWCFGLPAKDSLHMQLGELQFVVDDEGLLVELGCGSQAAVYLARLQGRQVAVKVFLLARNADLSQVWAEVAANRLCVHPRIVPLYGVAVQGPMLMLVMEAMEGGSLKEALCRPGTHDKLRWGAGGRQVALDVAEGLHYLHSEMRVMHSDLKSSNVLLSADGRACLADLGFAQVLGHRAACTAAGFSHVYAAPEQLMGQRCTLAADMYSFGILLVELTTQKAALARGELRLPQVPQDCPQSVMQLIQDCLSQDPAQRPTAAEALQRLQISS